MEFRVYSFPTLRVPYMRGPIIKTTIHWGVYWRPLFGKLPFSGLHWDVVGDVGRIQGH